MSPQFRESVIHPRSVPDTDSLQEQVVVHWMSKIKDVHGTHLLGPSGVSCFDGLQRDPRLLVPSERPSPLRVQPGTAILFSNGFSVHLLCNRSLLSTFTTTTPVDCKWLVNISRSGPRSLKSWIEYLRRVRRLLLPSKMSTYLVPCLLSILEKFQRLESLLLRQDSISWYDGGKSFGDLLILFPIPFRYPFSPVVFTKPKGDRFSRPVIHHPSQFPLVRWVESCPPGVTVNRTSDTGLPTEASNPRSVPPEILRRRLHSRSGDDRYSGYNLQSVLNHVSLRDFWTLVPYQPR